VEASTFEDSPTGSLIPIRVEEHGQTVEHVAFLPNPLEPLVELRAETWTVAMRAVEMLGRLDAVTAELGVDHVLLSKPTIRREALSTSALEGTFAPAQDVLKSEVDADLPRSPAVQEILNFVHATNYGVQRIQEFPIGTRLACELQDILVRGTESDDYQRGKLRETQVIIGPYKGCSVTEATYVPPPPGTDLVAGMDAWEKWLNSESGLHVVVRAAIAHYQFEALHPFTDGNGRIGRLIAILQLVEVGMLDGPLLSLSPYFERASEQYRYRLREVSVSGDWDGWIGFFCGALAAQAEEAINRVRALFQWRVEVIDGLRAKSNKGLILEIAESLIEQPVLNVKSVVERFGRTTAAANSAVNRLVEEQILSEITGGSYNRLFHAQDVIDILFQNDSGK